MKTLKLIATLVIGFLVMFATSLLIDLEFINKNLIRIILSYILVFIQFVLMILVFKEISERDNVT